MSGEFSPVAQLLDQWLLLPFFAHAGLLVYLALASRGRVAAMLGALLLTLAVHDLSFIWPGDARWEVVRRCCTALEPPLLAAFILGYGGGKHLVGRRVGRVLLLLAPAPAMVLASLEAGWGPPHPAHLLYALPYYALAGALLLRERSELEPSPREPVMLGAGMILLLLTGPVYDCVLPSMGVRLATYPYTSAAAGLILTVLVVRFKAFSPFPAAEVSHPGGRRERLPKGAFLARESDAGRARSLFAAAVRSGCPGIAFSRTHPTVIRREIGLARVPVIWLARSAYERALPPSELEVLLHALTDYLEQSEGAVALLEDVDYLMTNAGYFPTLDLLRALQGLARRSGATVLVSSALLAPEERADVRGLGIRSLPRDGFAAPDTA